MDRVVERRSNTRGNGGLSADEELHGCGFVEATEVERWQVTEVKRHLFAFAEREKHGDALCAQPARGEEEGLGRAGIKPLDVIDYHQ